MKLLSADDKERIYQSKKTNKPRRIKEALTIKDLGVEVSPERSRSNSRLYLKSPTVPAHKNFILTKRKAERLV